MVYRKRRLVASAEGAAEPAKRKDKKKAGPRIHPEEKSGGGDMGAASDPDERRQPQAKESATSFLDTLAALAESERISLDRELAAGLSSHASGGSSDEARPLVSPPTPSNVSASCPSNASSSTSLATDGAEALQDDKAPQDVKADKASSAGPAPLREYPAIHHPASISKPEAVAPPPAPSSSSTDSSPTDAEATETYRAAAAHAYAHAYAYYAHHYHGQFAQTPPGRPPSGAAAAPPPYAGFPMYYPHFMNGRDSSPTETEAKSDAEAEARPDDVASSGAVPTPEERARESKKRERADARPDAAASCGNAAAEAEQSASPSKRRAVQDGGEDTREKPSGDSSGKKDARGWGGRDPLASPRHPPHHFAHGYGYYGYYPPYYAYPYYAAAPAAAPRHPQGPPPRAVFSPFARAMAAEKGAAAPEKSGKKTGGRRKTSPVQPPPPIPPIRERSLDVASLPSRRCVPLSSFDARRALDARNKSATEARGVLPVLHGAADDDADAPLPPFNETVNYPECLPGSSSGAARTPRDDGLAYRRCVMCGVDRPLPPGPSARGRAPAAAASGTEPTVPRQNKGVCTDCDVRVWLLSSEGRCVKWCKGCKNFRPWAAFGEKAQATKCGRCRERQKARYAADKLRRKR